MAVQFKNRWLGVIIPSILILYLQTSTSYIMYYDKHEKFNVCSFALFQFANIMLWISYYLAIVTSAGSPPKEFRLPEQESLHQTFWRKWCSKCEQYKPERSHHCKACGTCVLRMDHHCPWTNNCIGYFNLPHFMRFLVWVLTSITYGLIYFFSKLKRVFEMRNLPSYLLPTLDLSIYIVNFLLISFVLLTIGILFIRCVLSITSNQTMIESWECERLQDNFYTEALWQKVRKNYTLIYPDAEDPFPNLKSWKVNYRLIKKDSQVPINFTYDDLVFPYDLGSAYDNLVDALGPIYTWMYIFGKPRGTGVYFVKDNLNEDQLKLPFPMDGYNVDYPRTHNNREVGSDEDDNELTLRTWANVMGETMESFGVDPETEDYKRK